MSSASGRVRAAVVWCVVACAASWLAPTGGAARGQDRGPTWEVRRPPSASALPVEAEPARMEFGVLAPNEVRRDTLTLRNTGESEVTIADVRSTCWCAAGEPGSSVLGPGETTEVEVTLTAPPDLGELGRVLYVFLEGFSRPVQVELAGEVSYGVRATITHDDPATMMSGEVTLESIDGEPFRVLEADHAAPTYLGGYDPGTDAPRARYVIAYEPGDWEFTFAKQWYVIATDHPGAPVIELPIARPADPTRRVRRSWLIEPTRRNVGLVGPGERVEFTLEAKNVPDPRGLDVRPALPGRGSVEVVSRGESDKPRTSELTLAFEAPGEAGVFVETVRVQHAGHAELLTIMGRVGAATDADAGGDAETDAG